MPYQLIKSLDISEGKTTIINISDWKLKFGTSITK